MRYRDLTPEQKAAHKKKTKEWCADHLKRSKIRLTDQYKIHPPRLDDEPEVAYDVSDIPSCLRREK